MAVRRAGAKQDTLAAFRQVEGSSGHLSKEQPLCAERSRRSWRAIKPFSLRARTLAPGLSCECRAGGCPRATGRSVAKPRANTPYFRAGDRIRGAEWYCEIAGVQGTVEEAVDVEIVDGQLVQDLLVHFDRPVLICGQPTRTFSHSARNFELIVAGAKYQS